MSGTAFRTASTYRPHRPSVASGTASASMSASVPTTEPTTVGAPSSLNTVRLPNDSASTDRSMNETLAAEGVLSATSRMASACRSADPMRSFTATSIFWIAGKDSTGNPFLAGLAMVSATHFAIFIALLLTVGVGYVVPSPEAAHDAFFHGQHYSDFLGQWSGWGARLCP